MRMLWNSIKRLFQKVYGFLLVTLLQRVVLGMLLAVTYFTVLGLTSLGLRLFGRRLLRLGLPESGGGSLWLRATGYGTAREDCLRQS
jgi:hypothetical protein